MPLIFTQNEVNLSEVSYADVLGEVYEYPVRYQRLVQPGEQFIYYRGRRQSDGSSRVPAYFGSGIVSEIFPVGERLRCSITNHRPFDREVQFKDNDRYREPEANSRKAVGFYFQQGVRYLDQASFDAIIRAGLNDSIIANPETSHSLGYASSENSSQVDETAMKLAIAEAVRRWPDAVVRQMPHNNPGFDIEVRHPTRTRYIEIKGTRAPEPRFFISAGEVAYSHKNSDDYAIWVFYSLDVNSETATLFENDGPVADTQFDLRPTQYLARPHEALWKS